MLAVNTLTQAIYSYGWNVEGPGFALIFSWYTSFYPALAIYISILQVNFDPIFIFTCK